MTVDAERFRAVSLDDLPMPGGWSVSAGQTFLYTPAEQRLMHEARAFAQKGIVPQSAAAHRRVKEIKATHEAGPERRRLLREMARSYLKLIGEAGLTGALFPEAFGGNGRGVVADKQGVPLVHRLYDLVWPF